MTRFRLYPSPEQEAILLEHCAHARFVWNLGHEQRSEYRPGRGLTPGYAGQCSQLTEARAAEPWLAAGSVTVQQQALRDLDRAWRNFFAGTHRRPGWRKQGIHEGFCIAGKAAGCVKKVNRRWSQALVPKVGWVRFRRSRELPEAKSYRIIRDRAGHWHIAFAAIPEPIPGPGSGEVVGIDRGVVVTLALSDGTAFQVPKPRPVTYLQRKLARAKRGSNRRAKIKAKLARLHGRNANARKDWAEKASTEIARRFDVIRIEDLRVKGMIRSARGTVEAPGKNVRQKAGLNRGILSSGWTLFATRLEHKAPGRVQKTSPAFTSQRCSACGHVDPKSRESQARFGCTACGFTLNADVNAARNIAAGHAVTARGGLALAGPLNREPQLSLLAG